MPTTYKLVDKHHGLYYTTVIILEKYGLNHTHIVHCTDVSWWGCLVTLGSRWKQAAAVASGGRVLTVGFRRFKWLSAASANLFMRVWGPCKTPRPCVIALALGSALELVGASGAEEQLAVGWHTCCTLYAASIVYSGHLGAWERWWKEIDQTEYTQDPLTYPSRPLSQSTSEATRLIPRAKGVAESSSAAGQSRVESSGPPAKSSSVTITRANPLLKSAPKVQAASSPIGSSTPKSTAASFSQGSDFVRLNANTGLITPPLRR